MNYCEIAPGHPWHGPYHDHEYGFPQTDDAILLERLALEINQAGLSWLTVLKKRQAFRKAFDFFDLDQVAGYGDAERTRLLVDASIIRNRRKIDAVIENARRLGRIRGDYGAFAVWLQAHHPLTKEQWVRLFKEHFVFVGGEIVGEFLLSIGYLPDAHVPTCPVYRRIARLHPPWMNA